MFKKRKLLYEESKTHIGKKGEIKMKIEEREGK